MRLISALVALVCLTGAFAAQAALFDDKEARKKILDVEAKSIASDEVHQAAINDLKKRISAIEAIVQGGGLADMQNQIELLKQEVARLKGDLEVTNHQLELAQQRQKDLYADTDGRLRKLESGASQVPASSAAPAPAPVVEEKDAKAFAEAEELSRSGKHKEAFAAYDTFLKDYPNSKFVPDAMYGLGYSQFALKNYKSAIATQQKVIDQYPQSPKVPDAMYNQANCQIQLGLVGAAKKTLKDLVSKYPDAAVTPNAQKRLKLLEGIK
ncbi:MAG TPA: tol-pal system protein YbgF [Methylophilus sp.]|nr:tol-pal system protein YbgF [Methylophilus sp.]HQQ33891.1 tol-pal system protein YbgF [Methylophilus sp.]